MIDTQCVKFNYELRLMGSKMKENNKRKKKNVNHNPQAESVKAVFGEPKAKGDEFTPHTFDQNYQKQMVLFYNNAVCFLVIL